MLANNVKRMTESKNHHSTTPKEIVNLGKDTQMIMNYLYSAICSEARKDKSHKDVTFCKTNGIVLSTSQCHETKWERV